MSEATRNADDHPLTDPVVLSAIVTDLSATVRNLERRIAMLDAAQVLDQHKDTTTQAQYHDQSAQEEQIEEIFDAVIAECSASSTDEVLNELRRRLKETGSPYPAVRLQNCITLIIAHRQHTRECLDHYLNNLERNENPKP